MSVNRMERAFAHRCRGHGGLFHTRRSGPRRIERAMTCVTVTDVGAMAQRLQRSNRPPRPTTHHRPIPRRASTPSQRATDRIDRHSTPTPNNRSGWPPWQGRPGEGARMEEPPSTNHAGLDKPLAGCSMEELQRVVQFIQTRADGAGTLNYVVKVFCGWWTASVCAASCVLIATGFHASTTHPSCMHLSSARAGGPGPRAGGKRSSPNAKAATKSAAKAAAEEEGRPPRVRLFALRDAAHRAAARLRGGSLPGLLDAGET